VSDTRAPDTGREHTTGALPRSTPDALMAARGLDRRAVPPSESADTELIETFAPPPRRRRLTTWLLLIVSALLGLLVLAGLVVSVLNMSDDSTRPLLPQAPLTPISTQARTQTPTLTTTPDVPSDLPAPPVPPLAPVTATAETVTRAPAYPREPSDSPRLRDRLHELFPRLFPENP
jgi:hypothetical protein